MVTNKEGKKVLAADPARVDKLVKLVAPMIYAVARADAAMYMRRFRDIIKKETGIDIFIKLMQQSPRFNGTIDEEILAMVNNYHKTRTIPILKELIENMQPANPAHQTTTAYDKSSTCAELRSRILIEHYWATNRIGYSIVIIAVQDKKCFDETCMKVDRR
jgi:hypothetical protein